MPHPQLLAVQINLIRKENDPSWFQRVKGAEMKELKDCLRATVAERQSAVSMMEGAERTNSVELRPIQVASIKEQKYYWYMRTYLHNGNQPKYEQYKQKAKEAMSEVLTLLMEHTKDARVKFLQDDGTSVFTHNEENSLHQARKMKKFNDNAEYLEAMAQFLELWK